MMDTSPFLRMSLGDQAKGAEKNLTLSGSILITRSSNIRFLRCLIMFSNASLAGEIV